MRSRRIPVLIVLVLIMIVGGFTAFGLLKNYRAGTTEMLDYEATMGLSQGQYAVLVNNEMKYYKAVEINGMIYVDIAEVVYDINPGFYWDSNEQILIYTKATESIKAKPGESVYHTASGDVSLDYEPVKILGEGEEARTYVSSEYIKLFTQCEFQAFTAPNRLVVTTQWGDRQVAEVTKDTVVRYRGGPKSEILRNITAGEKVTIIQSEDDWSWTNIMTDDGYNGWIEKKYLGTSQSVTTQAPAFEEEVFTYIKKDFRICMGFHQVTNTEASSVEGLKAALNNTQGINVIAPTWLSFADTEGNVNFIGNTDYVSYAHENGMEVWAVFANRITENGDFNGNTTDKILAYTSKRENMVNQVINYALEYGLDGINLDFEAILEEGSDNYIQFVRELSVACRNNNICLSIDNYVPIYSKFYNRTEQAKFADYLVIMGYDENGSWSQQAGPGASLPYVREGIEQTLEMIGGDASKVINGIPFYTLVWQEDPSGNLVAPGKGNPLYATMDEVDEYMNRYPDTTTSTWNSELGCTVASYVSEKNGNTFRLWIEDENSIAEKMKLIQEYNLAGAAFWKLQQEDAQAVWPVISQYMNY